MKHITKLLAGAAVATMVSFGAHAQEVTLTVHHFLGPKAPAQSKMIELSLIHI